MAGRSRTHDRIDRNAARAAGSDFSRARGAERKRESRRAMTTVPFSISRTLLIAQNTLLEAARQKLFNFLLVLALGLVIGARWFRDFNFGAPELKFLADCGFGAMSFFGAALTIAA